MEIKIDAKDIQRKKVSPHSSTCGRIYLPVEWVGKTVTAILEE